MNEKCATVIYFILHTFEVMFWRMILYLILDIHIPCNVNMEIQENKPIMLAWECIMLDYPIMFPTGNAHKVRCQPYKEQCHNLLHKTAFIMSYKLSYFSLFIGYPKCH